MVEGRQVKRERETFCKRKRRKRDDGTREKREKGREWQTEAKKRERDDGRRKREKNQKQKETMVE